MSDKTANAIADRLFRERQNASDAINALESVVSTIDTACRELVRPAAPGLVCPVELAPSPFWLLAHMKDGCNGETLHRSRFWGKRVEKDIVLTVRSYGHPKAGLSFHALIASNVDLDKGVFSEQALCSTLWLYSGGDYKQAHDDFKALEAHFHAILETKGGSK